MNIFIGSSKEQEKTMDKISAWIENENHKPMQWNDPGMFPPSEQSFHSLISISKRVDAAIFIFSEDDSSWYRDSHVKTVRFSKNSGGKSHILWFISQRDDSLPNPDRGVEINASNS